MVYYDELELCNPLGSRRKKHIIGKINTNTVYITCVALCYAFDMLECCTYSTRECMHNGIDTLCADSGAFYYLLGNLSPHFRSKIHNIQLLLLAKYSTVSEFGIDRMLEPIVEDVRKLESV